MKLSTSIAERVAAMTATATKETSCLRKGVGAAIVKVTKNNHLLVVAVGFNGPSGLQNKCTNVQGNCGCSHAEPRAIMRYLRSGVKDRGILLCSYSPCTNCANIIVDSGCVKGVVYDTFTHHDPRGAEIIARAMPIMSLKLLDERILKEWSDDQA
jgi:deoxycytidylate deaminase